MNLLGFDKLSPNGNPSPIGSLLPFAPNVNPSPSGSLLPFAPNGNPSPSGSLLPFAPNGNPFPSGSLLPVAPNGNPSPSGSLLPFALSLSKGVTKPCPNPAQFRNPSKSKQQTPSSRPSTASAGAWGALTIPSTPSGWMVT